MAIDYDAIEKLLAEGKTLTEVALLAGVNVSTISRFKKKLEEEKAAVVPPSSTTGDAARDEYRATLRKLLPVAKRAEKLAELAMSKQPAVALRAIELADQISGLGADQQTPPSVVPMFALPAGTRSPWSTPDKEPKE